MIHMWKKTQTFRFKTKNLPKCQGISTAREKKLKLDAVSQSIEKNWTKKSQQKLKSSIKSENKLQQSIVETIANSEVHIIGKMISHKKIFSNKKMICKQIKIINFESINPFTCHYFSSTHIWNLSYLFYIH